MLGAQARAAELQAAKSAALRQRAHQEAEEQRIPAQSTPVLLTDFARNPLLSKNKGAKAFRPLINSDFEGPERQAEPGCVSPAPELFATPTQLEPNMQTSSPRTFPTAPRAMRMQPGYSSPNPARMQGGTMHFLSSDHTPQAHKTASSRYDDPVTLSPYIEGTSHTRTIFGPDDLSPIKQEIKFTEMRQRYGSSTSAQCPPMPLVHDTEYFAPQDQHQYRAQLQHQDVHTQLPFDPYMFSRPHLARYQSEISTSSAGAFVDHSHMERTQSFANDIMNHQTELQHQMRARSPPEPPQPALENNQPYDRNSKMQSFVAAQQAMARKGKTVLHNPDLYRSSPLAETSTPLSDASSAIMHSPLHMYAGMSAPSINKTKESPMMRAFKKVKEESASYASEDPDSVLRTMHSTIHSPAKWLGIVDTVPHDGVGTEEWCTLRAISAHERDKMLRIVRDIAAESTIRGDTTSFTQKESIVGPTAREWLKNGTSNISSRLSVVEGIIDEYHKRADVVSSYGAIGKPLLREKLADVRQGPLKPVANIMAMLYQFAEDRRLDPNSKEYTRAPDFAIDGGIESEPFCESLFDDHAVASAKF